MAKRPTPKPEPTPDEDAMPEAPCPWNVEVEFNVPGKKSAMHTVHSVILDGQHIQLQLEDEKVIAYPFAEVHKVLSMHSTRFDAFTQRAASEKEQE